MLTACAVAGAAGAATAAPAGDLIVSQTEGLTPGQVVTVSGSGFDEAKGIYVAVCVDNGPGATPTPCLGGVDVEGSGGGSAWISSNPPSYAAGLPTPFGPGGTFEVALPVAVEDPVAGVDCREVQCAVAVRYDHTRVDDRTGDVLVPIAFAAEGAVADAPAATDPEPEATPEPEMTAYAAEEVADDGAASSADEEAGADGPLIAGIAGAVLLLAAGALLVARRRRTPPAAEPASDPTS